MQKLITEVLYLIAYRELSIPKEPLPLAVRARLPLILPCPPHTIQSHIDPALFDARLPREIVLDASSTALMLAAVIANFGVMILPWSAVHVELDEDTFKLIKIGHKLFSREPLLCWHDTGLLWDAVQKVKPGILEIFESLGRSKNGCRIWRVPAERFRSLLSLPV